MLSTATLRMLDPHFGPCAGAFSLLVRARKAFGDKTLQTTRPNQSSICLAGMLRLSEDPSACSIQSRELTPAQLKLLKLYRDRSRSFESPG